MDRENNFLFTGSCIPKCCARVTLTFCTLGAVLGLTLFVACGSTESLHDEKVFMYSGLLVFAVSIALIICLCSSKSIFVVKTELKRSRNYQENKDTKPKVQNLQKLPSYVLCPQCFPEQKSVHFPDCSQEKKNTKSPKHFNNCSVKNCVCLLSNKTGFQKEPV